MAGPGVNILVATNRTRTWPIHVLSRSFPYFLQCIIDTMTIGSKQILGGNYWFSADAGYARWDSGGTVRIMDSYNIAEWDFAWLDSFALELGKYCIDKHWWSRTNHVHEEKSSKNHMWINWRYGTTGIYCRIRIPHLIYHLKVGIQMPRSPDPLLMIPEERAQGEFKRSLLIQAIKRLLNHPCLSNR